MKLFTLLPAVALGTAFVIPDQEVMSAISIEEPKSTFQNSFENWPSPAETWEDAEGLVNELLGCAKNTIDETVSYAVDTAVNFGQSFEEQFDHLSWLESSEPQVDEEQLDHLSWLESAEQQADEFDRPGKHPHKRPHRRPHKKPHHGDHKPNQTVYELIAKSKYTTKLAKLINEYPDLVEALNGTAANYTVFAPTDKAFEKIPEHAPKPSKEDLKKILTYHVSADFYPAVRVLTSRTVPTLFKGEALGDEPQRLSIQISLKGLTVNFYSRIIAVNIFGTNGVIHGVDSILIPPPKIVDILKLLPAEFSTLDYGLLKTGLLDAMNDTSKHVGGTAFAPSNRAFSRLGPRINAFLFSSYGEKYLKALLEYHLVPNFTLYSDAFYKGEAAGIEGHIPKGRYHVDLPTVLEGKSLAIDIARFGRLIEIKINGYNRVAIPDGVAKDGVIHVVSSVLIPPKKPGMFTEAEEDLTVEEFKERFEPYVKDEDVWMEL